jgi:hypothetical protein
MSNDNAGFQRRQRELARQEKRALKQARKQARRAMKREAQLPDQMAQQPPMLGSVARVLGVIDGP